jgi:hypothetical protein
MQVFKELDYCGSVGDRMSRKYCEAGFEVQGGADYVYGEQKK